MRIDVLVFDGCPHGLTSWETVKSVAQEECPSAQLTLIYVSGPEEAEALRFLGSPSVMINGTDIEPERAKDPSSYSCRVYRTESGTTGEVPEGLLRDAIRQALRSGS